MAFPALWECKTMNAKAWRETSSKGVAVAKPIYAAQIAVYQAYMDASVPGVADNPALFTAINKDTAELHHELVPFNADLAQRMSDRAVRILAATDAANCCPASPPRPTISSAASAPGPSAAGRLHDGMGRLHDVDDAAEPR